MAQDAVCVQVATDSTQSSSFFMNDIILRDSLCLRYRIGAPYPCDTCLPSLRIFVYRIQQPEHRLKINGKLLFGAS